VHFISEEAAYIKFVLNNKSKLCICGCKNTPKWKGWKEGYSDTIRGHNARIFSAFSDREVIKKSIKKRKDGYKTGRLKIWNEGLTKETDKRILESSSKAGKTLREKYESGELVSWQTGLTKENSDSLKKMSETKTEKYNNGELKVWNEGLTKNTDKRLEDIGKNISIAMNKRSMSSRLSIPEVKKRIERAGFSLVSNPEDYRKRRITKLVVSCNLCENTQLKTVAQLDDTPICFICNPKESMPQLEIVDFIKSFYDGEVIVSDRKIISPKELDIVIPEKNIAIEYNGLYWHSESVKDDKTYHSNKTKKCNEKNIELFHIFSDEWRDKKSIIKSMIKYKMKKIDNKIYARNCEIKEVMPKERKEFFNNSHIDGDVKSKIAFGLYYDNALVFCMSFRKPFQKKYSDTLELARSSSALNTVIPGGISRLISHVKKWMTKNNYHKLLSYSDLRYGYGNSYEKCGFKLVNKTSNRFWWTDSTNRFNRFMFKADSKNNLSQKEVAKLNKVSKIWGCENNVYILELSV